MKNKKILTGLISSILIFFSLGWFFMYESFYVNEYGGLVLPIILFLLGFILFYLLVVLEEDRTFLYVVCSLGMIGSVFLGKDNIEIAFLIWLLTCFSCVFAIKRIKVEQYNRVEIDVYRILKRGIPIIGTVFTLLISCGFYFSIANLQKIGSVPRIEVNVPVSAIEAAFKIMSNVNPSEEISWISEGVTVDEYLQRILRSQETSLEDVILGEIANEPDAEIRAQRESDIEGEVWERERVIIDRNRIILQEKLGTRIDGNERIDKILHQMVNARAEEIVNGEVLSSEVLPVGGAFALFVTARSVVWISNMILFWTVSLIFSILVKLKIVEVKKEMKEVQVIDI